MSEPTPAPSPSPTFFTPTKKVVIGLIVLLFVVAGINKLTEGPSTKAEVCASFDKLGQRLRGANGIFDNAVFSQAGDLAGLAGRYKGTPDLSRDAEALENIADSNATNGFQLMRATQSIARLCGHSLVSL
jgi:hypothetical protein